MSTAEKVKHSPSQGASLIGDFFSSLIPLCDAKHSRGRLYFLALGAGRAVKGGLRWFLRTLFLAVCVCGVAGAELTYRGEATNEKGALVYTEHHRVNSVNGVTTSSITEYRAPNGELLASMHSDYSRSLSMPTYVFEDLQRNYREGLRWQGGEYLIFSQDGSDPEKTARLGSDSRVFSCQGWHYYLVNNLGLLEKDNITLNLVLPSELRAFPFVVKKLSSDESRVSAELSLKHWLFRYFAPKLRLDYDKQKRRLMEFQGVSNLLNKEGDRQVVTIRYNY